MHRKIEQGLEKIKNIAGFEKLKLYLFSSFL